MSIKTLRKRIALVAVSALGAGLMSLVAVPTANAGQITTAADDQIIVATNQCAATSAAGGTPQTNAATAGAAETDTAPWENAYNGKVIVVPVGSQLAVTIDSADIVTITGPLGIAALNTSSTSTLGNTNGKITVTAPVNGTDSIFTLNALAAGTGTLTVSSTTADATATLANTITISIVAACANTTYSAAYSEVYVKGTDATAAVLNTNVDQALSATAGSSLYINLTLNNGYGSALNTGTIAVSTTNGALVAIGNAATTAPLKGTTTAITLAGDGTSIVRVDPVQTATTSTTVVTITHNGTAVTTKTLTFHGEQAKIVIGKVWSGRTSGDNSAFTYTYQDSAGNTVPGDAAAGVATSFGTQITTATSIKAPTTSSAAVAGLNDVLEAKVTGATGGSTTNGVMTYTCGSTRGSAKFTISGTTTVNGNTITAEVTGLCYGGLHTYTVSTDKASYAVGEVAVITIEGKDASGNPVSDNTQLSANSVSVGGGSLTYTILGTTAAGSSTGAIEGFQDGKVTLRAQLTTAGKFNTVVALPATGTSSASTGYAVTSSDISNAEVLASIVKLIAAINKQIAALQKSLRR
jgi:hypothetical protein